MLQVVHSPGQEGSDAGSRDGSSVLRLPYVRMSTFRVLQSLNNVSSPGAGEAQISPAWILVGTSRRAHLILWRLLHS